MKKFSNLYVKYIIKTPIIFYLFLLTGIIMFLYFSLNLRLDVVKSVEANIKNNRIIIDGEHKTYSDIIYIYSNRNEKIYRIKTEQIQYSYGKTIFFIDNISGFYGDIQADIVIGSQTLFERIFVRAGRS